MRKLLAAGLLALPLGAGCAQVGGVCDCGPIPGDSTGYNPHVTYHCTCPGAIKVPSPLPPVEKTDPISTKDVTPKPNGKTGSTFESIGPPKPMPMPKKSRSKD